MRPPELVWSHNHGDIYPRVTLDPSMRRILRFQRYPKNVPSSCYFLRNRLRLYRMDDQFHSTTSEKGNFSFDSLNLSMVSRFNFDVPSYLSATFFFFVSSTDVTILTFLLFRYELDRLVAIVSRTSLNFIDVENLLSMATMLK